MGVAERWMIQESAESRQAAQGVVSVQEQPTRQVVQLCFLALCFGWVGLCASRELPHDRIDPYDSVLHASNGALFKSMFEDFGTFAQAPINWLVTYYNRYPAQSLRRNPPVFGLVEGIIYQVTGVSVLGAHLTVLIFALALACGMYLAVQRASGSDGIALASVLLFLMQPHARELIRMIWLDLPALAFAAWAFYLYIRQMGTQERTWRLVLGLALLVALSLYTYVLPIFLFVGLFLHLLATQCRDGLRDRKLLVSLCLLVVLLIPLMLHTCLLGRKDNLIIAVGGHLPDASPFVPVSDRCSLSYWTHYATVLGAQFPLQAVGLVAWVCLWRWRRPRPAETLFFLCFVVNYLGFSWIPSKVPRYAVYLSFLASPLAASAGVDILRCLCANRERLCRLLIPASLVGAVFFQILRPDTADSYVTHMDRPARAVLQTCSTARVLYCGPLDCAFTYYFRQADIARQGRVARANVQITDAGHLRNFLHQEKITFIAFDETELRSGKSHSGVFLQELLQLISTSQDFERLGEYGVLWGPPGDEREVLVVVYVRADHAPRGNASSNSPLPNIPKAAE
jgi:4-amino-4-deoxy-L-arabinose transferase-like glycosyltransferase